MKFDKLLALCLALCMLLTGTFCTGITATSVASAEETTADEQADEMTDFVMAYVNGEPVMYSMVSNYAEYIASNYGYDDEITDDETREIYLQALNASMGYTIMGQKAEEMGLTILSADEEASLKASVAAEWAEYLDYYSEMMGGGESADEATNAAARSSAEEYLASYGYTEDTLYADAVNNAWYEKLTAELAKDVVVSEDDVQAAFDQAVAEDKAYFEGNPAYYEFVSAYYGYTPYYIPAGFRGIKQILLAVDEELLTNFNTLQDQLSAQQQGEEALAEEDETETADPATDTELTSVTQEQVDAARNAILASVQPTVDVINAKLASGVSFDELIAEYNTDPGMNEEPAKSEGYSVSAESIMYDAAFIDASYSINTIGEVSAPFVGSYGVYVVQYFRDVPEGAVTLTDELRNTLYENALSEKESAAVDTAVDAWLNEADVIVCAEAYEFLPVQDAATEEVQQ